ncbi:zinc metallopeptidase [Ketobacter sp.]
MILVLLALLLLGLMFYPQYATRKLLQKHNSPRADFPGTGGQFAEHLIQRFKLTDVSTEITASGDHYDPQARCVRLSKDHFEGKSLTAVVVAAHEVGHAIQHHTQSKALLTRTALARFAFYAGKAAQVALVATPLLTGVSPGLARLSLVIVVGGILMSTLVHLITLPVEWDASFNKAMPVLREGDYLSADDLVNAKRILTACAMTYVSASLGSLVGVLRWVRWLH